MKENNSIIKEINIKLEQFHETIISEEYIYLYS